MSDWFGKIFIALWCTGALLVIAFWGFVVWVIVKLLQHFAVI